MHSAAPFQQRESYGRKVGRLDTTGRFGDASGQRPRDVRGSFDICSGTGLPQFTPNLKAFEDTGRQQPMCSGAGTSEVRWRQIQLRGLLAVSRGQMPRPPSRTFSASHFYRALTSQGAPSSSFLSCRGKITEHSSTSANQATKIHSPQLFQHTTVLSVTPVSTHSTSIHPGS